MPDVLVLCYHAVSERFPAPLSVTPEAFERQLQLLAERATGARPSRTPFRLAPGEPSRSPSTTPTCRCCSWPSRCSTPSGFPATVYAPTAYLDTPERPLSWDGIEQWHGGEHERELLPMSWDQLGGLAEAGWEIGSHTRTHPHLTTIDDESLRERAGAVARGGRATPRSGLPDDRLSLRRPRRARRAGAPRRPATRPPAPCRPGCTASARSPGPESGSTTATTSAASG